MFLGMPSVMSIEDFRQSIQVLEAPAGIIMPHMQQRLKIREIELTFFALQRLLDRLARG
jgi:hypothetical protein